MLWPNPTSEEVNMTDIEFYGAFFGAAGALGLAWAVEPYVNDKRRIVASTGTCAVTFGFLAPALSHLYDEHGYMGLIVPTGIVVLLLLWVYLIPALRRRRSKSTGR